MVGLHTRAFLSHVNILRRGNVLTHYLKKPLIKLVHVNGIVEQTFIKLRSI